MILTKFVLKRPVTALLVVLAIVFFGIVSFRTFKYELMPEINMPMYIVATVYPGAAPEDIDDIITKPVEEAVYNLQGVKTVQGSSRENASVIAIQYNYGQNMDIAYNDLKKTIDSVKQDFNDSINEPTIVEMDMNAMPVLRLAVRNSGTTDIYNYVKNTFVKEIEKIAEVASVDTAGGRENYIKIELIPEMMKRYNLNMTTLSGIIKNADFAYPAGTLNVGNRELSFSSEVKYDTVESLKSIPIATGNKRTLYLEDVANIYEDKKAMQEVGRYNEEDCMIVSVTKTQSSSSVDVSRKVLRAVEDLKAQDKNLIVNVVTNQADNINASIESVFQTMFIAILLSMFIIFLFFGDIKASLIVGTSIPFSILSALSAMKLAGFTLNIITLSSLVLGVGMMVDNSIVLLEACFRAKENHEGFSLKEYIMSVVDASNNVGASIFGSTLTTVVVFAPIGFITGMAGQFFKPLAFTIVFCMLASFVSAITLVPLTYCFLKPKEKKTSPAGHFIRTLQEGYRSILPHILNHRVITLIISIGLLVATFMLVPTFKTELVSDTDEGMIQISIETKPSLNMDEKERIYKIFEEYVVSDPRVDSYVLSNSATTFSMGGSSAGQSLIAILKDEKERKDKTSKIISEWKETLSKIPDCAISVSNYATSFTSTFVISDEKKYEVILDGNDYDELKALNDQLVKKLEFRDDLTNITTTLDNGAPVIKATIDPLLAAAEGFVPAQVGGLLYSMLSGTEIMDMKVDGEMLTVNLEYPSGEYDSLDKVESIELVSSSGAKVLLKDIATITFEDSPATIPKYNKKYRDTITCHFNDKYVPGVENIITEQIVKPSLNKNIQIARSYIDTMQDEEFGSLYISLAVAVFLVFIVMASQFESVRFSIMVMGTILFSFIGSVYLLWLNNLKLSMVVLLGLMMLIGTAVNNGILYVDTVNQMVDNNIPLKKALVESGAIRLRPIMMTTLTTIVSMIPMSLAYGENGEVLQPLAVVNIGGLISSTLMAIFVLPVFYLLFSHRKVSIVEELGIEARHMQI